MGAVIGAGTWEANGDGLGCAAGGFSWVVVVQLKALSVELKPCLGSSG